MRRLLRQIAPTVLTALAAAVPSAAEGLGGAADGLVARARGQQASFCSAAAEFRGLAGVTRTPLGDFDQRDLIATAKAVFGEASPHPDEQCGVALTIFNRAHDERRTPAAIVTSPGQFQGYSSSDRRECGKLKSAAAAVRRLALVGSCSYGVRRFKYFCSRAAWNGKKHGARQERPEFIGDTAFLVHGPC